MEYENLHTCVLEKVYGPLRLDLFKQDEKFRLVHLRDEDDISRTFGVVKFLEVAGEPLKTAHNKILDGAMLGKTLFDYEINFDKKTIGSFLVELPTYLMTDFNCKPKEGIAVFSRIMVRDESTPASPFTYSELIEVMPYKLGKQLLAQTEYLSKLDKNLLDLCEAAEIKPIKNKKRHD